MNEQSSATIEWAPPQKIEMLYASANGGAFSSINSSTAGARTEKELNIGQASIQLYSMATPNGTNVANIILLESNSDGNCALFMKGQKVGILLEELGIEYDAHMVNLQTGDQFTSGFVAVNPNSKLPAAVDKNGPDGQPINLFESASIMIYFAEKFGRFMPTNARLKVECMNWVFWQMGGQGPMGGNFNHFMLFAPKDKIEARNYGTARYGMEVQRLCSVLDRHLEGRTYMVGEEYSIADMMIYPWFAQLSKGFMMGTEYTAFATEFLTMSQYTNAIAWSERLAARPAVQRGMMLCKWGATSVKPWIIESEISVDEIK